MDKNIEILQDYSADQSDKIISAIEIVAGTMPELQYAYGFKFYFNCTKNQWGTVSYTIYDSDDQQKRKWIGGFKLEQFPGCRHAVVSTGAYVDKAFRGKGIGKELNILRIRAMSLAGFKQLYATVRNDNLGEEHILKTNGWKRLSVMDEVSLWMRVL